MAMSLLTRNALRMTGTNLLKNIRTTPMKAYTTTILRTQRGFDIKPILKLKPVASLSRQFLTSPAKPANVPNHTTMWTVERCVSLFLLGCIPLAFMFPSRILDSLMAISVIIHTHWGIEAMLTDYLRPQIVGELAHKGAHFSLLLLSVVSLGGLFYLIFNDVGIAKGIQKLWGVSHKQHD